jgi:mannose-6-phosphate isomerase-like protein (cupin superfamily)
MKAVLLAMLAVAWASSAAAQGRGTGTPPTQPPAIQPPATQPPPTQPARPRPTTAARPIAPRVTVRDQSGTGVPGAKVMLTGATTAEFRTDESGSAILSSLKDGTYRIRCEQEGFVTLEREFVVRGGQPASIEVTLNRAPAPTPPPPAPTPPPEPKPAAPPPIPASGPPVTVNIVDFAERNQIGSREPLKESVLACNGLETVRLLQLQEPVAEHTHSNMDEVLYVVAGDGIVHLGTKETLVSGRAASLLVVPHGTPHRLERRGRTPLVVLSMLSGAPCPNVR